MILFRKHSLAVVWMLVAAAMFSWPADAYHHHSLLVVQSQDLAACHEDGGGQCHIDQYLNSLQGSEASSFTTIELLNVNQPLAAQHESPRPESEKITGSSPRAPPASL